jgi:hypothetical protein
MSEMWKHYFKGKKGEPTSISFDLGLAEDLPFTSRPWSLRAKMRMNAPRPDGLSSSEEAPTLFAIEDALLERLRRAACALQAGRITAKGERHLFFYAESAAGFEESLLAVADSFPGYELVGNAHLDAAGADYKYYLYPSEEEFQLMANCDLLGVLGKEGDTLSAERNVDHWVFFECSNDRAAFRNAVEQSGFSVDAEYIAEGDQPYAIQISRSHAVTPDIIDDVVLGLYRLAKQHDGNYDGWESEVVKP